MYASIFCEGSRDTVCSPLVLLKSQSDSAVVPSAPIFARWDWQLFLLFDILKIASFAQAYDQHFEYIL